MNIDSRELSILAACGDIRSILLKNLGLFDFRKIDIEAKAYLLDTNFKLYSPILNPQAFATRDRVYLVTRYRRLGSKITFSDSEFKKMSAYDYVSLLRHNFKKYINPVYFEKLSDCHKKKLFVDQSEWVYKNTNYLPEFTVSVLTDLLDGNPEFLLGIIPDIVLKSTTSWFWGQVIGEDPALTPILLENISTLATKTDTRQVFKARPWIVKLLTFDHMQKSKLDAREWVLLINTLIGDYPAVFKDWSLPEDIQQELSLDVSVILISGQNKLSKRLNNSIKKTISKPEEVVLEEDVTSGVVE